MPRGLACCVFAVFLSRIVVAAPSERPNVLLLVIDDLNDWVGCLGGHPEARTPKIDGLARQGTLFANAHCQAPLCNPSRTSLLTGRRPSSTGVYALDVWFRDDERLANIVTLPQAFMNSGYYVMSCGKIFHDAFPPRGRRLDGVEVGVWGYHGNNGPMPEKKFVDTPSPIPLMDWGIFPERDEDQDDWMVADWAIEQLDATEDSDKPWFLGVGFRRPHVPCYASQAWFDQTPEAGLILPPYRENDREDVPEFAWFLHWDLPEPRLSWLRKHDQWHALVRAYLASTSFVDSQVGRVLDALDRSGQAGRTIVVLTSDHGFHLGEKEITGKNTLWERSTRVPLVISGPRVRSGQTCRQPAELLDLYPTLLEMAGIAGDPTLEGHSMVPQLRDEASPRPWPAITTHGPGNHAIRTVRHRFIRYADGSEEVYDLELDPNEWENLAGNESMSEMKRELAAWIPRVDVPPIPGGASRLLERKGDGWYWEGKRVEPGSSVPGVE
jgi:choline-sulfatase